MPTGAHVIMTLSDGEIRGRIVCQTRELVFYLLDDGAVRAMDPKAITSWRLEHDDDEE